MAGFHQRPNCRFLRGCHDAGTRSALFLSPTECTLPRRGTRWKCLQGSLTIHGSTSLLMGPTTILIIDVVIDNAGPASPHGIGWINVYDIVRPPHPMTPSHLVFHLSSHRSPWFCICHLLCVVPTGLFFPPLHLLLSAGCWCWRTAVRWVYDDDVKTGMLNTGTLLAGSCINWW